MRITIINVGSVAKEYKDIIAKLVKKIGFYAQLQIIEIKEIKNKNITIKKTKETNLILNKVPKNTFVILCSLEGPQITSEKFSNYFRKHANITFIIGGSNGVIEKEFKNKIGFSLLTFPHQLFKVLLIEQIFRGLSIINNSQYHK